MAAETYEPCCKALIAAAAHPAVGAAGAVADAKESVAAATKSAALMGKEGRYFVPACTGQLELVLVAGAQIRLKGLSAKPEFKVMEEVIIDFDEAAGRWRIRVEDCTSIVPHAAKSETLGVKKETVDDIPLRSSGGCVRRALGTDAVKERTADDSAEVPEECVADGTATTEVNALFPTVGARVRLKNLKTRTKFNGKHGVIHSADPTCDGKYRVFTDDGGGISVWCENLEELPPNNTVTTQPKDTVPRANNESVKLEGESTKHQDNLLSDVVSKELRRWNRSPFVPLQSPQLHGSTTNQRIMGNRQKAVLAAKRLTR